jgi:hypothetical protein
MAKQGVSTIKAQTASVIKINGNKEITPPKDKSLRDNVADSFLNLVDGGLFIDAETGYSSEIIPSDPKSFATKKYVDDLLGSSGITSLTGDVTASGSGSVPATVVWTNGYPTYDLRYLQLSGGDLTGNLNGVTPTEISYISGLTSPIQTQLNSKEPSIAGSTTDKYWRGDKTFQLLDTSVVPENGSLYYTDARLRAEVLTGLSITGGSISAGSSVLSAFGALQNQINGILGGATYQGVWNASTNIPSLSSGTGTKGFYYVVNVAGSTNLDGITDWKVGDWAIFNGTTWDKVDNTDAVSSVNGAIGAISLGGTANRIDVTGTTWDISSSYVGQSSITTLGTITTGAWNGTAITDTYIASASIWNAKQDALIGTGFVKSTAGVISYDTNTYALVAGSNTQIQYNNSGVMGASANFAWDYTNNSLIIGGGIASVNSTLTINTNVNNYYGTNVKNTNTGVFAASEHVVTADTGTLTTNYGVLGINNSTFVDAAYSIMPALSTYLYSNGGDITIGTQSAKSIIFHTGGTLTANNRGGIDSLGKWSVLGQLAQTTSFTGLSGFTITGGATTINSTTITYNANTTIKRGDGVSCTGVTNAFVIRIISSTSCIINTRATATNSGLTVTVYPSDFGNEINYTRNGITNSYGSGLLIDYTDSNQANTKGAALTVLNRNTTQDRQSGINIMSGNTHLVFSSPEQSGSLPVAWFQELSNGGGGTIGNYVLGTLSAGARTNVYQMTSGGLIQFNNTLTGTGVNNSSTSGFRLTGGNSTTVAYNSVNIGWENGSLVPTAGAGNMLTVGTMAGLTSPWSPTTGSATLKVIRANVTINQTGVVATGGVSMFSAEPVITSLATTGYIRGYESNIASGAGTRHNLYISGTAQNSIVAETTFGSVASPAASTLIDMISTTRGLGVSSMTSAQRATMGVSRNGNIVYQNDGTQAFYGVVNGVSVPFANVLRASIACTAADGGAITAWSGTTDYTYTITVTGAVVGQNIVVNLDNAMASTISTNSFWQFAWVSAANTVKVRVRVATFINVTGNITVAVI